MLDDNHHIDIYAHTQLINTLATEKLLFTPVGLLIWSFLTNEIISFMQIYV